MKYVYLKLWTCEQQNTSFMLETVYLLPELLVLQMKGNRQLCVYLSAKNSFPFITEKSTVKEGARNIWPKLKNNTLSGIRIASNDRIVYMDLQHKDIYGESVLHTLVLELMPPKPNAILLGEHNRIVDALFKYSYADNSQRQVLPNLPYQPPKTSFIPNPQEEQIQLPDSCDSWNGFFYDTYQVILHTPTSTDASRKAESYLLKELKKLQKKLAAQEQDLGFAAQADYLLACAEALKPNLGSIKPGQTSFQTINYLSSDLSEIKMDLLPDKSPKENLQLYIKKYHKAKNGYQIIQENISKTQVEIDQVLSLLRRIEKGEQLDLEVASSQSVRQLISTANASSKLLNLHLGDEYQIVIGRKARENDFITTQLAKAHDYWFHSRIYHGAHVLLRCFKKQTPPPDLIELCCNLAAGYSKAKNSLNVPVDYTQIRFVRKPRKSPPGFVTYTNHHSVYASPMDIRKAREILCEKQS